MEKLIGSGLPDGHFKITDLDELRIFVRILKRDGGTLEYLTDYINSTARIEYRLWCELKGSTTSGKAKKLWEHKEDLTFSSPENSKDFKVGDYIITENKSYSSQGEVCKLRILTTKGSVQIFKIVDGKEVPRTGYWQKGDFRKATRTEILASKYAKEYNNPFINGNNATNSNSNEVSKQIKTNGQGCSGQAIKARRKSSKIAGSKRLTGNKVSVVTRRGKVRSIKVSSSPIFASRS